MAMRSLAFLRRRVAQSSYEFTVQRAEHEARKLQNSSLNSNGVGQLDLPSRGSWNLFSSSSVYGFGQTAQPEFYLRQAQMSSDEWLIQRARAGKKRREAVIKRNRSENKEASVSYHYSEEHMGPSSSKEKLAGILGRPDLIITRNVEWANLAFGFEQQNKYVIMDPREPQAPVGYILEDSNVLMRQFLRRRRPFIAVVLDAYGNEVFRVRRPAWVINSTIYVEVDGQVIGEAHRRWHLWRRIYDVYLGNKQFAGVENPGFWHWTFSIQDENKGLLAVIDRNWRGFGYEFLTDAGQYVVRFGDALPDALPAAYKPATVMGTIKEEGKPVLTGSSSDTSEIQSMQAAAREAEPLVVDRPLSLLERAVTLALAVSLDNDYFSIHSGGIGFVPLPFFGGGNEVSDAGSSLPMDDGSSVQAEDSEDVRVFDVTGQQAELLERIIDSDDTSGESFQDPWSNEDVEEAVFGDSSSDSRFQDEPQGDGDIFDLFPNDQD